MQYLSLYLCHKLTLQKVNTHQTLGFYEKLYTGKNCKTTFFFREGSKGRAVHSFLFFFHCLLLK